MANMDVGRRIRAARELAGLRSVEALADRIDQRGFSDKTLYPWEQGKKIPTDEQLAVIARACGVPLSFFTVDFQEALGGEHGTELAALADRLAALELRRREDRDRLAEFESLFEDYRLAQERRWLGDISPLSALEALAQETEGAVPPLGSEHDGSEEDERGRGSEG